MGQMELTNAFESTVALRVAVAWAYGYKVTEIFGGDSLNFRPRRLLIALKVQGQKQPL